MKIYEFRSICHWILLQRNKLAIFHHWFRQGFFPGRYQAIISTHDGQFIDAYMRHSASMRYAPCVDYNCVFLMPCEWLIVVHVIKSSRISSHNIWHHIIIYGYTTFKICIVIIVSRNFRHWLHRKCPQWQNLMKSVTFLFQWTSSNELKSVRWYKDSGLNTCHRNQLLIY